MRKVKALLKDQAGLEKNKIGLAAGFPGGSVIKSPPFNAGDVGSIPGRGTKISHATKAKSWNYWSHKRVRAPRRKDPRWHSLYVLRLSRGSQIFLKNVIYREKLKEAWPQTFTQQALLQDKVEQCWSWPQGNKMWSLIVMPSQTT